MRGVRWVSLASALGLSACAAVGPNFAPPKAEVPVPTRYADARDRSAEGAVLTPDLRVSGPWWRAFGSHDLDSVMDLALAHNQSVTVARATLERARAVSERERAALLPYVGSSAAYQRERINITALGFPGLPSPTIGLYSVGANVSYDLDLAGGARRRLEEARAVAEAEGWRADAAYLTLTGDVALQAVIIAALRDHIEGVERLIADDRQSIDILRRGEAAGGDAASARLGGDLQLARDAAVLPPLRQRLAVARHALALLAGQSPAEWSAPDFSVGGFTPPAIIPVAVPSELVQRRPDIQAAQADLHADTALIGVETARLYPDVRLAAGLTQEALNPAGLFNSLSAAYNFGPSVTAPLFDGGAIRADRRAALAQARADLARYRQTVLTAFGQVSDVLSALGEDEDRLGDLGRAEAAARASLEEARRAYDLGGAPLAAVVAADRQWREANLARQDAVSQRLSDIIALYAATASDWRTTAPNRLR